MPAAPAVQRETVGLVVVTVLVRLLALVRLMLLRLLPAGDEGRQPLDIAFGGRVAVLGTLRLVLLLRKGLCIARDVRLRLARTIR